MTVSGEGVALRAVILNAYRRSNAGDGLLVDEAIGLVQEALPGATFTLVSMEPSSFAEYGAGLHPVAGVSERMRLTNLLARLVTARPHPAVADAIRSADIAVAVGGGYIRGDHPSSMAKAFLSHMVQAPTRENRTPYVYLPQSIGPLPSRLVPFGASRLKRAHAVFVRDDRSRAELAARGIRSTRMPDLAVIAIGTSDFQRSSSDPESRPGLIARSIVGRARSYSEKLNELAKLINPEILVQSSGAGNDDRKFYDAQGWGTEHRGALQALDSPDRPNVVVSVRLHGALQSILAGVPAVHLSYERKGWGAFEDLGIAEYVHNARSFDPGTVARQVEQLSRDATAYWEAIEARRATLASSRPEIIRTIRDAVR